MKSMMRAYTILGSLVVFSLSAVAQVEGELPPAERAQRPQVVRPAVEPEGTPNIDQAIRTKERAEAKAELEKLPRSGVLSATNNQASGRDYKVPSWDGAKVGIDRPNPIVGSINDTGKELVAQVTNNSQEKITGSAKIIQKNKSGATIKSDFMSFNLASGETHSQPFVKNSLTTAYYLELTNWKIK